MTDSSEPDGPARRSEQGRAHRIRRIKRWVACIESTPADEWVPQQNRVVDSQLDAARESGLSAEHFLRVERAGAGRTADGDS